jgi:hypothetical protein
MRVDRKPRDRCLKTLNGMDLLTGPNFLLGGNPADAARDLERRPANPTFASTHA